MSELAEEAPHEASARIRDASRLLLALFDALGVQLAQPPAGLRRLAQAFHQVGEPRVVRDKPQRLPQLLLGRLAVVQVLVDRVDRRLKLPLGRPGLLRGHGQGLDHVPPARPDHLLVGKQDCQADAENLRPFKF